MEKETVDVISESEGNLKLTGEPCTLDSECLAGQCLTTEFVKNLNPSFDVPFGMCSRLMCSDDSDCKESASCFDGTALTGGTPIFVCLKLCQDYYDCRYTQGYECFADPSGSGKKACLPESIIKAIRCGDKICDENEKTQNYCPEDCK